MQDNSIAYPATLFPWQTQQWEQIWRSYLASRLSHALLLVGYKGMGKSQFASTLANAIVCQASDEMKPCLVCHDCRLVKAHSHPSLLSIKPAQTGGVIKIDQIREAVEFVSQTALQGSYRIVTIEPADAMNDFAANALLKTLEEPSAHTLIILITEQSSFLRETLLSRCQRLAFLRPSMEMGLAWLHKETGSDPTQMQFLLNLTQGAPLEAIRYIKENTLAFREELFQVFCALCERKEDPSKRANQWQEVDTLLILHFLFTWLTDMVRLHLYPDVSYLINCDHQENLLAMNKKVSLQALLTYLRYLERLRRELATGIHLNKQLLLESLLIRWQEAASCII